MELDMYLYRCGHLNKETLKEKEGKKYDAINDNCILIREKDTEDTGMYKDLLPFMDSINVQFDYFNEALLKKDFNIPEDAVMVGRYSDNKKLLFSFNNNMCISLSRADFESKYIYYKLEKAFICSCEEVAYWRKAYDLSDEFNERHEVENCGYYLTSYDELHGLDELFSCFPYGIPVVQDQKN